LACGRANPAESSFCLACGSALALRCAACDAELPGDARFCNRCGSPLRADAAKVTEKERPLRDADLRAYTPRHLAEKILASKSAIEGERKQVTVLFADVKSSMELAESVGPEEWHRILDGFFQVLADGVHRFEGTVNQYTGDGIMALFGAPIAHEDHAQRACFAALHLADALRRYSEELKRTRGLGLSVRIGLNSGEVVVGKIGDDLRMDYTAQGHTVGLAQRMEQLADPGKAYLTGQTAALVSGYFKLRELGAFTVKGVREPVPVFELEGVGALRTRLDVSRARGFSRFVGRADELAALEAALARAVAGQGQVVGVVADAGTGKSRLCFELAERCRARGVAVHEAHAVSHGKMIPFLPLLQLLRSLFGVRDGDAPLDARRKIAGTVTLLDASLEGALPLLLDFLGVSDPSLPPPDLDPEARQRQLVGLVQRLVRARPAREPALLLVEDLHWLDGGSETFVEALVESVAGTHSLLVVNFRPEYHAPWMQRSWYQQLPLAPLGAAAIDELLAELLGQGASLGDLAARIRERTAGNPFFIEEMVLSLAESGALAGVRGAYRLTGPLDALVLPATVQAVLAARIDRLAEREKQVLQAASVLGKEFSESILSRVLPVSESDLAASLRALVSAELVYQHTLYPEAEYAFKHPLTQEVAYRSQLASLRAETHRSVASAILDAAGESSDEQAAVLAHHFDAAGDPLEAARWHERAARRVVRDDLAEALRHWRRVRELAAGESPELTRLRLVACLNLLDLLWRLGDPEGIADEIFEEGTALAERSGDRRRLALLHLNYGAVLGIARGQEGPRRRYAHEALRLLRESGDARSEPGVLAQLTVVQMALGRFADAIALADEVLAHPEEHDFRASRWQNPRSVARVSRARSLAYLGRPGEGRREILEAIETRMQGDHENLPIAFGSASEVAWLLGDAASATSYARLAIEFSEKVGLSGYRAAALVRLGAAHGLGREWPEAIDVCEQALGVARERRLASEAEALAHLALARLGSGDVGRAREAALEAVALAAERGQTLVESQARIALARALRESDGPSACVAIEAELDRAAALIEEMGARVLVPRVLEERARLAHLLGDEPGFERGLRAAQRLFAELDATGHAERLAQELAT
jgi:class 3 adenylate cyclase/tetratricopeptide (TPR) repeat protein